MGYEPEASRGVSASIGGGDGLAFDARALRLPSWAPYALFAVGYLLLARMGHLLLESETGLAVWWPPSGFFLTALLIAPRRRWPLVVATALPAAALAGALPGQPPVAVGWLVARSSFDALAGAWVIRRVAGPRPSVASLRGALAIATLPALAAGALWAGALAAEALLRRGGLADGRGWALWAGSSLGSALVAPLAIAWMDRREGPPLSRARWAELAALVAAVLLALAALYRRESVPWVEEEILIPPLLWAALRFGPRGATLALAAVSFGVVLLRAPLAGRSPDLEPVSSVLSLQFFLAVLALTVLLVAAAAEERRRAAHALARSRELLDAFFGNAPLGMFIKDERHRAVVLSRHFSEMLGTRPEALLGKTAAEALPPPLGEALLDMERAAVLHGAPVRREISFAGATVLDVVFPIPRAGGASYVGGFAVDVSDRKRAETALSESEERLRLVEAALDQASDAVRVLDEGGRYVWANAAHARQLGLPKDRLLGRSLFEVAPHVEPAAWRARWAETAAGGPRVREELLREAGGRSVPGEVAEAVVEFGGHRYFVCSARDVSDRRRAEAAARLAGIGTMAAGVAHEINNPLAYVLSNVAWLRERLDGPDGIAPDEACRVLGEVEDGAVRVREIVQQLRLFARPDDAVGPVDVRGAARSALTIAQNELRHRAAVVTRFSEVPRVTGNENRLAQVFLNLLTNAAQAIPEGRADGNTIVVEVRPGAAGEVIAEVSDTGAGMAPDVRARVFEPFFTTKPVGIGTGLGLFICHGIVAGMGGRIEVESQPAAGTTVRITLPAAGVGCAAARENGAAGPLRARGGCVLVLDDDTLVATALRRALEPEHRVDVSTDPREALDRVHAGETWDVVFCDLMMPGMSGMEWFEEVRRAAPRVAERVVFMTGGAFTDGARDFLARVPNANLSKPFVPDEVRALVASRLAGALKG